MIPRPFARTGLPRLRPGTGRGTAFAILLALSFGPTLAVEIPALVDYPNHLARMSILARDGTAFANPFYEVAWGFYPNLAMDLVVPVLARAVGVVAATKMFYLSGLALLVSGAVAIELAVKRRFDCAGFVALLYLHAWPVAFGFLNFTVALGIALWGIAAWLRFERGGLASRCLLHGAVVLVLYVGHMFALGIYGLAVGLIEARRTAAARAYAPRSLAIYPILAAPVAILSLVLLRTGGSVGGSGTQWGLLEKIRTFPSINGFSQWASGSTTLVLVVGLYGLARSGALRFEGAGLWLAAGFAACFLAMPVRLFDTAFVDVRIVMAAAFIVPAFVEVRIARPGHRVAAAIGLAGIALLNLATVARVQMSYAGEYRRLVASFSALRPKARVLVAHSGDGLDPPRDLAEYPIFHAPVLAVHYADAFVPTLFAYPGKQPVRPRASMRRLSPRLSNLEGIDDLARIARGEPVPGRPAYLADWTRDFDYLYVVGPVVGNPLPGRLAPIGEGSRYSAYEIRHPAEPAPGEDPAR